MSRRDFLSFATPERCAMDRFWDRLRWVREPREMRDQLPAHYRKMEVAIIPQWQREFERQLDAVLEVSE